MKLRINDVAECKFIYDTGSENSIFFDKEIAEILNFKMVNEIRIMGSDLTKSLTAKVALNIKASTSQDKSFTLNMLVLNENIFDLDKYFGFHLSGIVGNNMFQNKIVQIDYENNMIHVYDADKTEIDPGYTNIDATWIDGKPYVHATLDAQNHKEKIKTLLLFDTGATMSLLLYNARKAGIAVPDKLITGYLGMGMGGPINGFIGKYQEIGIDTFRMKNIITHFSTMDSTALINDESKKEGLFGNVLISKYLVLVDYKHEAIYLTPNKSYYLPTQVDRSGLLVIATGLYLNEYLIKEVGPDSPAEKAGLLPGDRIRKINAIPASWISLPTINNILSSTKKEKVRLTINRAGQRHKIVLYLKDIL